MNTCGTCKYFGVRLESWRQGESTPTNYAFCQLLTHMRATIYGGKEEVLSETDVEGRPEAQTAGVECRKDSEVIDEIPGAYKDIQTVMDNQSDLVTIVAELRQIVCVKG